MSKELNKANARLKRRQQTAASRPQDGLHRPGSMNPHKTAALSTGKRTRDKIKADSRTATQR